MKHLQFYSSNEKNIADINHKTKKGKITFSFPHSVLDGTYGKRGWRGDLMYNSIKKQYYINLCLNLPVVTAYHHTHTFFICCSSELQFLVSIFIHITSYLNPINTIN